MRHRLRVLIQNRPDAFKRPGGDTVQMLHTRDGLRRLGIPADISLSSQPNLAEYSLVHLFHCTFPHTARQQANAVRQDVPYVLSPIAVDYGRYYFYQTSGPRKRALRRLGGLGLTVFRRKLDRDARRSRAGRRAKRVLDGAAALLPNSEHEQSFIRRRFRPDSPSVAIKIAPDTRHGTGRAERFRRRWAIDDFVM